jgi:hypothetical protein
MKAVFQSFEQDALLRKRLSFHMLRWAFWVGMGGAALSALFGGIAPLSILIWSIPFAIGWLVLTLKSCQTEESPLWNMLAIILMIFGSRAIGVNHNDVPFAYFLQWLFLLMMLAGAPLWFSPSFFYRVARLDRESEASASPALEEN